MNTRYKSAPEIIATARYATEDGEDVYLGDKVVGLQVMKRNGLLQLDIRDFKSKSNLVIEIELHEIVSAISLATLNAENE